MSERDRNSREGRVSKGFEGKREEHARKEGRRRDQTEEKRREEMIRGAV